MINKTQRPADALVLEVKRVISATPQQIFDAWTTPDELVKWWGPEGVDCISAQIDLNIGGKYQIVNQLSDKSIILIEGMFEEIEIPNKLVYSWKTNVNSSTQERVAVSFVSNNKDSTEVTVRHERIESIATRDQHLLGWEGCLDSLREMFSMSC